MSISNLDFVYTDTLLPYEERLKGKFVYLNKDYGEYKKGVYFYGENELERLTNDFVTPINPTGHVQLPEFNNTIYTYNGEKQTILPSNWEDIEKYVYIAKKYALWDEIVKDYIKEATTTSFDNGFGESYDHEYADREQSYNDGYDEGIETGSRKSKIEIAKSLLKNNIDINIIIDSTGITKEELNKLQ